MSRFKLKGTVIVATLVLVIFLLGLLGVLLIQANYLNKHIKDNLRITVFFQTDLLESHAKHLSDSILNLPFSVDGKYVSADEAVFNFKEEIGEDFVEILGNNPLPSSVEIVLLPGYNDPSNLSKLEKRLLRISGVLEVSYPQNVFQQIESNRHMIGAWLAVMSVILLLIAVVLISNTIRIAIHNDRILIRNQQLIGATDQFIMRPYKRRAVGWIVFSFLLGLILLGSVIWLFLVWLSTSMGLNMSEIGSHFMENWYPYILMLFLLFVGSGTVIYISTHIATKKYLKLDSENVYD